MGDALPKDLVPPQIDATKLKQAVDAAFEPAEAMTTAFVVTWRGQLIAERYAPGVTAQTPLESWSMGKTVLAVLMGMLVQDGTYDLWARAPISEWDRAGDPRSDIRIADLLRMSSGLRFRGALDPEPYPPGLYLDNFYAYTADVDVFKYTLSRPQQWPAGTIGRYRNSDPIVVADLIGRASSKHGQDLYSFAQSRLFDKIGMRTLVFEPDTFGNPLAFGYSLGSARDWARLGILLLQDGRWNGEQLVPEAYLRFMRTAAPAWEADGRPWYGGFVWLNRGELWPGPKDSYALVGSGGQSTIVYPTHDLVIVRMGHVRGEDAGVQSADKAVTLLLEAVPQSRPLEPPPPPRL
jgi:CubicO group peptidase (beta-lactamase class C family)